MRQVVQTWHALNEEVRGVLFQDHVDVPAPMRYRRILPKIKPMSQVAPYLQEPPSKHKHPHAFRAPPAFVMFNAFSLSWFSGCCPLNPKWGFPKIRGTF